MRHARISSLVALIALAALVPATSRAAQVSSTYTFDAVTLNAYDTSYDRDFSANAAQFDPALGTLNSIGVVWSITLQFTATEPSTTTDALGDSIGFSGGASVSFNGSFYDGFGVSANGSATAFDVPFSDSDTEGVTDTLIGGVNIAPATFNSAIGTGTIPVAYPFEGSFDGAPALTDLAATSFGSVKVTYNYSPAAVPLPSSLSLSILGMGALLLLRVVKVIKNSRVSRRVA